MFKYFAGILLTFMATAVFSQGSGTLPGIPVLTIPSIIPNTNLAPPTLQINTNQNITSLENCVCMSGCYVLPIKLLSFEGYRVNTELVQLSWSTTNEFQNKGFEVERALGNSTAFMPVVFMPAQTGPSAIYKYDLPDDNNYSGTSYYRLKQVDINGGYTYSPTIAIQGYDKEQAISLYPNPVAERLVVDVFLLEKRIAMMNISDAAGKKLLSRPVHLKKGINHINLSAASLKPGVYFLQVISPGMSPLAARLIKL